MRENLTFADAISKNAYLGRTSKEINAAIITNYLRSFGWTDEAIAATLGNMETESTINPGIWENLQQGDVTHGFGLVQWTPATKLINWCNENGRTYTSMQAQLDRILWELATGEQWIPTSKYPMSFENYTTSTETPEYLAQVFLYNYERPAVTPQTARSIQARNWYNYIKDIQPPETDAHRKNLSLLLLILATRRRF